MMNFEKHLMSGICVMSVVALAMVTFDFAAGKIGFFESLVFVLTLGSSALYSLNKSDFIA